MIMSSPEDRQFELYSINVFSKDFPLSHRSVLGQIIDYAEHLERAPPRQESNAGQPRRHYTFSYLFQEDTQQRRNDEAEQFAAGQQKKKKHPREPKSRSSSEEMQNAIVTHKVHAKKTKWTQTPPDGFMSNSAAPEQMNTAGDGVPPNRWDSLSDDVAGLRKDGLAHKPGSDALAGGSKTCSTSGGDRKVTATSSEGTVPNTSQISPAMAQKINYNIKYELRKEVRKFGRKYERIFTLLEGVQGPPAVKKQFVDFTIQEAARFKRVVLIQQLEKVLETIPPSQQS
ncbi:integrator complex subunit 6-like [Equus przewalskii]|uniref:Integrator complex subunit 6-like n=1 Tax=Equus przewalskii TaxID=9798 RepID=A0ABM2EM73_EQUPR